MRSLFVVLAVSLAAGAATAGAQDRRGDQTEPFSRKVQLGTSGRVSVSNVSGRITVTAGPGDQVSIEAVKRTNGDRRDLADVRIEVDSRPGRVDVRTEYTDRLFRGQRAWVDYTIVVPSMASVELRSVSGAVELRGVQGSARAESVSGAVTIEDAPRLEMAKSVSGSVSASGVSDGDLTLNSVSGGVTVTNLKAKSVSASTVSGRLVLTDALCERLTARSVSGSIEYSGSLAQNGRYELNTHSGSVRFIIPASVGFELDADTFSGSIRSDFPMTVGGDGRDLRGGGRDRSIRATFGDGKAQLIVHTFSGSVAIQRR